MNLQSPRDSLKATVKYSVLGWLDNYFGITQSFLKYDHVIKVHF